MRGQRARASANLIIVAAELDYESEFQEFHARLDAAARRYAGTILGPGRLDECPDVLQDAWARAWRMWRTADPDRREHWFFRIVRNCALDRHRAGRRLVSFDAGQHDSSLSIDFDSRLESDDALRLLSALPVHLRETLWLRAVQDLSYQEIAAILDVPVGTVMSRLNTARTRLARRIGRRR